MHNSWRVQDGSLPAGVFSVTQTSDGFLWFLSLPGDIYRFDGVRFLPWRLPAAISNRPIGKIFGDHTGGLWVVSNELIHLKNGVVTSHFELKGLHGFQSISEDPDGSLWVALRFSDTPVCHVTDGAAKCFGNTDGITISHVNALVGDGNGGLWLGGQTGVLHWRQGTSEIYPTKAPVTSLARGSDGTLWVGIEAEGPGQGLGRLQQGAVKPFVTPTFDGSTISVVSLMLDRDGNLWVGSDSKGLFRIHANAAEHYGRTEGLSGDSPFALFEDREGIVWVGTTSGIDAFRGTRITTFSQTEGLGKDLAAGILATGDGTVWVANNGSLDRIKNGTVSSTRRSSGLPGDQVAALLEDHAGNIWAGVDDGLFLWKDDRFRRLPEPNHQPLGMVVGMTEDNDGNIWAECASKPRRLVRIRDFRVQEVFPESQVPTGHNLAPDPGGGIWIETLSGDMVLFRNGKVETTVPLYRGGSPLHRQIIPQQDGSVLAGTENGLLGWRKGTVQRMTTKNGLPCDFIISFIEDKEKRWWLYTRCGVVEFSDAELQRWWVNSDTVIQNRVYDTFDGAQPNIGSFNAAAVTPDGRVWFSSGLVVQMVDPSTLAQDTLDAVTYIETVTVDRREFQATNNITIPAHPRDLRIDYTSPTYTIPQKVRFRYRLDGYDHDWHDAGIRRQAFYTDLPPGSYAFRVMACNHDGVWSDSAARLDFSIAPAYYQTYWFRALCAAFLVALLWTAYQMRVRHLNKQFEMTLDARVAERTRIARDLHDTLLQSAHGVLLRFQTVSHLLPERPVEAKERLDAAIDQTAEFITEARDQVQGLRESTVQSNDLALAINALGEELAAAPNNHRSLFRVAVEGTARDLHPIVRDEIYRIATEALRNSFRHARASQVEVEIRYDNEQFRLRVRDDGKGIDPAVLSREESEGHFGLSGMRERAKLIGGKLTVWSEINTGSEIELRVSAGKAYVTAGTGSWLSRKFAAKS